MGISVRFPSDWLHHKIDVLQFEVANKLSLSTINPPTNFIDAIRSIINLNIQKSNFNVEYAAKSVGYSKQKLQRKLKSEGTNLSNEIAIIRKQKAIDMLMNGTFTISDISERLGFINQASFTRFFIAAVNMTPTRYRNEHLKTNI